MNIIKLPTKLPSPDEIELPRAQLCALLQDLNVELMKAQGELMKANNAPEMAEAVRATVQKLTEARGGWLELSRTIRDSWGI